MQQQAITPIIRGNWTTLSSEKANLVLNNVVKNFPKIGEKEFVEKKSEFEAQIQRLDFYDDIFLVSLTFRDLKTKTFSQIHLLMGPNHLTLLDGTTIPIFYLENIERLDLRTTDQILAYLEFYCSFVWGGSPSEGQSQFKIICANEDLGIDLKLLPDHLTKHPLSPPKLIERNNQFSSSIAEAYVSYCGSLFLATFAVQPNGGVGMLSDNPIWEMPKASTEQFVSPWRIIGEI